MPVISQVQERGRRLVEDLAGVTFQGRDLPALDGAVAQEMSRLGMARATEYLAHLEGEGAEEDRTSLMDLVVNNETYFFREPQHFASLREILLSESGGAGWPEGRRLRVLSAGCATGEEAYSLAIEMLELGERLPKLDFEVLGADISRRALEEARRGVYGRNSFRGRVEEDRLSAWFESRGDGGYAVSETVGRHVTFHCLNLRQPEAVKATLGMVDVIFFRNVLIYLSDAARREVCWTLQSMLRRSGHLFLGTAEILPAEVGGLRRQQAAGGYYWTRAQPGALRDAAPAAAPAAVINGLAPAGAGAPQRLPHFETDAERHVEPAAGHGSRRAAPAPVEAPATGRGLQPDDLCLEAVARAREDRAGEALEVLRGVMATTPDHPVACRLMAELHLDRAEFDEAQRLGDRAAGRDETLAWPYVLRGRVAYNRGDGPGATAELRKAIYHRPDWWPAHFYLAEVYRAQGEEPLARRAYANALRNLERGAASGRDDDAIIGLTREDVAATCRANLQRSGGGP